MIYADFGSNLIPEKMESKIQMNLTAINIKTMLVAVIDTN